MAGHTGGRRLLRLCATAFVLVLSPAALGAAQTVQAARASSSGANRIDPQPDVAPVGAQVDMRLVLYTAPSGQQLRLTAAPWGMDSACLHSQPIPGVAPFDPPQPLPAVTDVKITWPGELAHGQFAICALATGDNSVVAASFAPFTVDDGTITPTPTRPPERYPTPAPTASVLGQTDSITPGSDIHISIAHWFLSIAGGHGTVRVGLLSADVAVDGQLALTGTTITDFSLTPQSPDGLVLTLTLPPGTTPGSYRVVIVDTEKVGVWAATQPFTVVSAALLGPSLGTQSHSMPALPAPARGPTPLTLLVAAMLALAVLLLAGPALARRLRRQAE